MGFVHKPGNWCGINVIMKSGNFSELPLKVNNGKGYFSTYVKPESSQVKRIVMKGDNEFGGVIFYDQNN